MSKTDAQEQAAQEAASHAARGGTEAAEVAAYRALYHQLSKAPLPEIPEHTLNACSSLARREQRKQRIATGGKCGAVIITLAILVWATVPVLESIESQVASTSVPWVFVLSLVASVLVSRAVARRMLKT